MINMIYKFDDHKFFNQIFTQMKQLLILISFLIFGHLVIYAQKKSDPTQSKIEILRELKKIVYADSTRLVEIFKDIHQNPELPFQEKQTSTLIAKELLALGFEVQSGIGKTGVVGTFKNGTGPIVMYRADMDCNAVKETTKVPYASVKYAKNDTGMEVPVMHACGHDAHVTWMLGIAKAMVTLKSNWSGTLILIGQPAEEIGEGADAMAAEMYQKGIPVPDYLLGMHTAPVAVGMYLNMSGDRMAGADQLDVTFFGIGGHGSAPQETKDPIVMSANAILQYQTIISRNLDPQRPAVLTVGAINAGIDNNVIPASVILKLNLRWFNEIDRKLLIDGIKKINEGIAFSNGLPEELYPKIKMKQYVTPLKNNKILVDKINPILELIGGPGKNLQFPPVMGSEDFHHLIKDYPAIPYDYILVGIANPKTFLEANAKGNFFPFFNHNSDFLVDLSAIPYYTIFGSMSLLETFKK
ncbi:MAG: hypothetical protein RL108_1216 [Bacteroidota bacterium]|jgi:amidohydrolase